MNLAVLRPPHESYNLTELQKAEELIKCEMTSMLQYDNLKNVVPTTSKRSAISQAQQLAFLEQHPYEDFKPEDLKYAKHMLKREMDIVKYGMSHGELPIEAYTQVWEECLGQVLFVPNLNKYTRANLVSKKERLESAEKRLEQNRGHMAKEAKKAAKMEKKLKILTGGYQSRAQALIKQLQDYFEQIDQASLELNTFKFLQDQEKAALPRRMQSLTEDVSRQMERERGLQNRYAELQGQIKRLQAEIEQLQAQQQVVGAVEPQEDVATSPIAEVDNVTHQEVTSVE